MIHALRRAIAAKRFAHRQSPGVATPGLLGAASSLLFAAPLLAQEGGSFWLPPARSTTAHQVDNLFFLVLGVSVFFFALIAGLLLLFVLRYRQRAEAVERHAPTHNTALEVMWTVVPVLIVMVIFYQGFVTYLDERTPPRNAYDIRVAARQWTWNFQYPNGFVSDQLHVPVDETVRLTMSSDDVIHSLFIPAFRLKMDVVPGRYTSTWFRAETPGEYELLCAEFCGTGHSDMVTKVVVHKAGEFEPWLKQAGDFIKSLPPAQAGRKVYELRGCKQCHSIDGSVVTGPSFKGLYGETVRFTDGTGGVIDDNFIRDKILDPQAKIRVGFQGVMPRIKGITSQEITVLIEFIKSLKK
jgi:cytochrome c oxidase subunit 2